MFIPKRLHGFENHIFYDLGSPLVQTCLTYCLPADYMCQLLLSDLHILYFPHISEHGFVTVVQIISLFSVLPQQSTTRIKFRFWNRSSKQRFTMLNFSVIFSQVVNCIEFPLFKKNVLISLNEDNPVLRQGACNVNTLGQKSGNLGNKQFEKLLDDLH